MPGLRRFIDSSERANAGLAPVATVRRDRPIEAGSAVIAQVAVDRHRIAMFVFVVVRANSERRLFGPFTELAEDGHSAPPGLGTIDATAVCGGVRSGRREAQIGAYRAQAVRTTKSDVSRNPLGVHRQPQLFTPTLF
jgi:hypothetical protein